MESYRYSIQGDSVSLDKWLGRDRIVAVPGLIEGYPVKRLAPYAFADTPAEEILLPQELEEVGAYAFYRCYSLKILRFYNRVRELGAGAFTGCHKIRLLDITFLEGEKSCLREFLGELREELRVEYHGRGKEAVLMFPEFYEEGVENTPARILETHVHGSGIHYRNCFLQQEFQFREYDSRFPMARAQESPGFVIELVMGRLRFPWGLDEDRKKDYQEYLRMNREQVTTYLGKKGNGEEISWWMDCQHRSFPVREEDYEL